MVGLVAGCTNPEAGITQDQAYGFGGTAAQPAVPTASAVPGPSGISTADLNSALYGTPNGQTAPGTFAPTPAPGTFAPTTAPGTFAPIPANGAAAATLPGGVPPAAALPPETVNPEAIYSNSGISDEQDFKAVSERETIESDKARIEANKAKYQQIAPTALPERTGKEQVSPVIAYVLQATNRLGEQVFERSNVSPEAHQKACLKYTTGQEAQEAFLKAGGPKRDPKRLDPDGDGYACDFDPTPFKTAIGN